MDNSKFPYRLRSFIPLSKEESARFRACERTMQKGFRTFMQVGTALAEIRTKKLYRQNYSSFENYCRDKWKIVASRARQLIAAAKVVQNLENQSVTTVTLPGSERLVRPLVHLTPEQQREAWTKATANEPNPSEATQAG